MERVLPTPVAQTKQVEQPQNEAAGKSMAAPGFQLTAGDISAPIQKKDDKSADQTQCVASATAVEPKWQEFADKFNVKFKSVLHVFPNIADPCAVVPEKPAEQSMTPATLPGQEVDYKAGETCEVETTPSAESSQTPATTQPAAPTAAPNYFKTLPTDYKGSDRANASQSPDAIASGGKKFAGLGDKSGIDLTAYTCSKLFTTGQRDKILSFIATGQIPERLFNGDDIGNTTAQQRILMSALIMAQGQFKPGSFEQKVHARMCWHWVHLTNDYAGTSVGSLNSGAMGSSDFMGNASFNTGKASTYFDNPTVLADALPTSETGGLGPIHEGTGHKEGQQEQLDAIEKRKKEIEAYDALPEDQKKKKKAPKELKKSFGRKPGMDWSQLSKIEPGDWLYIYNANGSDSGNHSVVFSHWASDVMVEDGIQYRVAVMFSQGQPEWGGREHTANIGAEFYHRESIKADKDKGIAGQKGFLIDQVTWATRFSENSKPVSTPEELIPHSKKDPAQLDANNKYIESVESKKGFLVNRTLLQEALRAKGHALLDKISTQLPKGQVDIFKGILAGTNIEKSVKAIQKLTALATNLDVTRLDATKKNAEHATWETGVKEKTDGISKLEADKKSMEDEKTKLTDEQKVTGIPALKSTVKSLEGSIKKLKKGDPKIVDLQAEVDKLKGKITTLEADPDASKKADERAKEIKTRLAEIAKALPANKFNTSKLSGELEKLKKNEPFITAHPGNWSGKDVSEKTDGKLENIISRADLEGMLSDKPYVKPEKTKPKKK